MERNARGGAGGSPVETAKQIRRTRFADWVQVDRAGRVVLINHVLNYFMG